MSEIGGLEKLKKQFEEWSIATFGDGMAEKLLIFDDKNGYRDTDVNGMWIGFCGHALLTDN